MDETPEDNDKRIAELLEKKKPLDDAYHSKRFRQVWTAVAILFGGMFVLAGGVLYQQSTETHRAICQNQINTSFRQSAIDRAPTNSQKNAAELAQARAQAAMAAVLAGQPSLEELAAAWAAYSKASNTYVASLQTANEALAATPLNTAPSNCS